MTNTLAWFEIPVSDMERAKAFYEQIFDITIEVHDLNGLLMGWFPPGDSQEQANGTLIKHESYIPSQEGPLIYFRSNDVAEELDRVEKAGGKVYQPKTQISEEYGYMGVFLDSEGNRIALHSMK